MTDGVQRVCPKCAELNNPNSAICSECGAWLIELTPEQLDDFKRIEQADGRRIIDPEHEPDDPDLWMPHWKPRGDTARVPRSIPPKEKP
jgi:hypothetical protein